jgi:hypothetical protein
MQSAWKVVAYVFWVGAATLGAYLLMTTHPGKSGALFLARPQAQLWILALAVQAGLWAAVAPFLWRTCREFSPATPWGWAGWVSISAVVAVLFLRLEQARLYGPGPRYPLAHHGGRLLAVTIAGVVLVLESGILAMCLIWQRLRATAPPDDWNWPAAGKQAGDLLRARERLGQVLLALGLAVGAVTLATGALRSAVLAYLPQESSQFPALLPGCLARVQPSCWPQAIFQHISRSRTPRGASLRPYTRWNGMAAPIKTGMRTARASSRC